MGIVVNGADLAAVFGTAGAMPARIWVGTAVTNGSGAWSVNYASAAFASPPIVHVTPVSADATAANQAVPQMIAPTVTGVSGTIMIPNTTLVAGAPFKAAGAGVIVMVIAVGS